MQLKFIAALAAALCLSFGAHAQEARVVASCGTLPSAYAAGSTQYPTVDVNGKLCLQSASAPPSGAAGGDLGGTYPNPTVTNGSHLGTGTVPNAALVSPPTATGLAATGQIPGTTTNDNASVGNVGELIISGSLRQQTATVTFTNASPTVVSWASNPFFTRPGDGATAISACASIVSFTGGTQPTGITTGLNYYVTCGTSLTANSFQISTTTANAIAGISVNTTSTGSGTQTGAASFNLTSATPVDYGAMSLTAGDWEVSGLMQFSGAAGTSISSFQGEIGTTSGSTTTPNAYTIIADSFAAEVIGNSATMRVMTPMRISLSNTTTVFCVMNAAFTVSTLSGNGMCRARRMR